MGRSANSYHNRTLPLLLALLLALLLLLALPLLLALRVLHATTTLLPALKMYHALRGLGPQRRGASSKYTYLLLTY